MSGCAVVMYRKEELPFYIKEILALDICKVFLEVGFVDTGDQLVANYRTEGFCSLQNLSEMRTEDILSVAIELLHGIYQSEKHCIFSELYQIEPRLIFTDRTFGRVKMIFRSDPEKRPASEKLSELLHYLQKKGSEEGATYIENAAEVVRKEEYGYKAVVHHLENLRREVYLCSVR